MRGLFAFSGAESGSGEVDFGFGSYDIPGVWCVMASYIRFTINKRACNHGKRAIPDFYMRPINIFAPSE